MSDPAREEVEAWWREAEKDRRLAQSIFEQEDYNHSAFLCEQAAQKALKALLRGLSRNAWGHKLKELLEAAYAWLSQPIPGEMEQAAESLGEHYTGARYPGVLSPQAPSEFYTLEMAQEALRQCDQIMNMVKARLRKLFPDMALA
jgi:HEPN domain-containing protein